MRETPSRTARSVRSLGSGSNSEPDKIAQNGHFVNQKTPDWVIFGCLSCFFNDVLENFRMIFCHGRQDFSIKRDIGFFESVDESTVAHSKRSKCGVQTHLPQTAHGAFFGAAVAEGVDAGFEHGRSGLSNFRLASPHHALSLFKQAFASFDVLCTSFYSWHIYSTVQNGDLLICGAPTARHRTSSTAPSPLSPRINISSILNRSH